MLCRATLVYRRLFTYRYFWRDSRKWGKNLLNKAKFRILQRVLTKKKWILYFNIHRVKLYSAASKNLNNQSIYYSQPVGPWSGTYNQAWRIFPSGGVEWFSHLAEGDILYSIQVVLTRHKKNCSITIYLIHKNLLTKTLQSYHSIQPGINHLFLHNFCLKNESLLKLTSIKTNKKLQHTKQN